MTGFGCVVLAHNVRPDPAGEKAGVGYVQLDELFVRSHAISLRCPLLPATYHPRKKNEPQMNADAH